MALVPTLPPTQALWLADGMRKRHPDVDTSALA